MEILAYQWAITLMLLSVMLLTFSAKSMMGMFRYFITRKSFLSFCLLVSYLVVVLCFLGIIPIHSPYRSFIIPTIGIVVVFFPHLFTIKGIKNPHKSIVSDTSFELFGAQGQYLPVNAPELGIFLVGAPGCGKTKYIIEPVLFHMIRKGYSGILYDYDFSNTQGKNYSLSSLAYNCCLHTNGETKFLSVNFQDVATSSRINPIAPRHIQDRKKLSNCLRTFLLNLNPQSSQKEDFWHKNTYALLKGLVVFLANKHPLYCSIPHVIMLGLQSASSLTHMLYSDEEAKLYASPVLDAFERSNEQFAGVISNFKVSLERLLDPAIFWVLSGDDVPHMINDPENPVVVCFGNTPSEKEVLSPVLAMAISGLIANMYSHDRNKSFLMIDELPTLFLPHLNEIPATARKYNIATIVALQSIAQLEKTYGVLGAREIQETFSNHFVGRSAFRLSKELSDMFGHQVSEETSQTISSSYRMSKTVHKKDRSILKPQEIMSLGVGEFVGKVADSGEGFFRMRLQPIGTYDKKLHHEYFKSLPEVHAHVDTAENFYRVQRDITQLVSQYN
jgi:hypothetical protein